jgi:hypothetical protein
MLRWYAKGLTKIYTGTIALPNSRKTPHFTP